MIQLTAMAWAKLNLGLEILGRRADGYHDVATVMQSIALGDRLVWTDTGEPFRYIPPAGVARDDDLLWRALQTAPDIEQWSGTLQVAKQIPMAAGLGGGSSDGAAGLWLAHPGGSSATLRECASSLGSDVPFLISGGTALATGTGITLASLPTSDLWFTLVVPELVIPDKTRTLYRGLELSDYSDGKQVQTIAAAMQSGKVLPSALPNGFTRQLLTHAPIQYAYERLRESGASEIAMSGAGPSMYVVEASEAAALARVDALQQVTPRLGMIMAVRALPRIGPDPAILAIAAALRANDRD